MQLSDKKNSYARSLSGGMRRRLLIAKALVHDPEIIFLDEPTAGVDVELRMNLWNYIKSLSKQGKTICLTTHYLEEAEKLCDYIAIINNGQKIVENKKDNLINLFSKRVVEFTIESEIVKIPDILSKYIRTQNENKLTLEYGQEVLTGAGSIMLEDYHDYSTGQPALLMQETYVAANIQTQSPYASNLDLNTEAGYDTVGDLSDDILDFTERNPFGEVDE